jgi:O-antigen/teichoic acid export membrane protein
VDRRLSPGSSRAAVALGLAGLVLEVVGTFLPWLRSGTSLRNSYAAGGALRRLLHVPGAVDALLAAWPALGLVCAAAVASWLLGGVGRVLAGVLALLASAAAIAAAAATFLANGTPYAQPALVGPTVTLIGATVIALAAVWRVVDRLPGSRWRRPERRAS